MHRGHDIVVTESRARLGVSIGPLGALLLLGSTPAWGESVADAIYAGGQAAKGVAEAAAAVDIAHDNNATDEKITALNDQTQVALANIVDNSTRSNAATLASTALFNASTAAGINWTNGMFSLINTLLVTGAKRAASKDWLQSTREQMLMNYSLMKQKIASAYRGLELTTGLARAELQASLLPAGVTQPFRSFNSLAGITVRNVGFPVAAAVAGSAPAQGILRATRRMASDVLSRGAGLGGALSASEAQLGRRIAVPGVTTFASRLVQGSTPGFRQRVDLPAAPTRPALPPPGAIPHDPSSSRGFLGQGVRGHGSGGH